MTHNNFKKREITKIYKTGSNSSTIVIPKQIAKQSGLDESCHVIIESTQNGIMIKKIDLDDVK